MGRERGGEVVGVAFEPVSFPSRCWGRVRGVSIGDDLVVAGGELALLLGGHRFESSGAGVIAGIVDLDQQSGHIWSHL